MPGPERTPFGGVRPPLPIHDVHAVGVLQRETWRESARARDHGPEPVTGGPRRLRRDLLKRSITAAASLLVLLAPALASGQPLGSFRWQLQPFCNVLSLSVTQNGGIYRLEGTDDQCAVGRPSASAIGTAFQNPNGSIGFGLNLVTAPGGAPVHVEATIALATLSGTWRDSAGTCAFVLPPARPPAACRVPPVPAVQDRSPA